ncbi:MAG: 2-C-methyl-D-erythritol 4-phosphate cytidylyltransferase [Ktedonobacteraceae bacterium]|nr:2-C-methyl-D-erythritol 4-phosphate cytidylyltransferase [Ktedonobacteraceae bacterium]
MQEKSAVVIVAAGTSHRLQGRDKLWLPLSGRITLARTVDIFQTSPLIDLIVLVTAATRVSEATDLCQHEQWNKVRAVVAGGTRRQDSVRHGLDALAELQPDCRYVMIHDGARPFVSAVILERALQAAHTHPAATAAVPVKETIKQVEQGYIVATPERSKLWTLQTPQIFSFPLIYQAHHSPAAREDVADDATLLRRLGYPVAIFAGDYSNFKITTQEDLLSAEALLQRGQHQP